MCAASCWRLGVKGAGAAVTDPILCEYNTIQYNTIQLAQTTKNSWVKVVVAVVVRNSISNFLRHITNRRHGVVKLRGRVSNAHIVSEIVH